MDNAFFGILPSLRDFRYAARSLRKSPGLTAAAILTLALGIGANTAIFTVLEGVVLAPLPYSNPDRLVVVALYNRTLKYATRLSYPDFLDWQRNSRSFDDIAAFRDQGFDLSSPGVPEHLDGEEVSSEFFRTLGVNPALGRELSPEEDRTGGPPAVVISDRLWRDRFAARPSALGRVITLDGIGYAVVGVLEPEFRFESRRADVYTAIGRGDPLYLRDRTVHNILCVARLKPELSLGQARAEMNTVQEHIDRLNPATEQGQGVYIDSLKHDLVGDVRETLLLLLGATGLVLLIACANVANLQLTRAAARTREFAVRLALGASRGRVARELIAESVLLSLIGGALGLAIAAWGVRVVLATAPGSVPRIENAGVNGWVLLFALVVSVSVGILFGLAPALQSSKTDLQTGLRDSDRGALGSRNPTQRVLVVAQVALALVLLSAGTLLFCTIRNLGAVNPGFDTQHVITFQAGLSASVKTASGIRTAYQELVGNIRQVPGVRDADISALVPLSEGANEGPFWIGPRQPASMARIPRAIYYPVGPDYLNTMRIPLLRGRSLAASDELGSERVVVIDTLLARRYFPSQDPIGRSLTIPHWGAARNVAARVVGVAGHVEQYGLDGSLGEKPQIYYCFYQLPDEVVPLFRGEVALTVRTPLDAAAVMPAIRAAVHQVGADQPVYNVRTMQELVEGSTARQRFPMLLLVAFAVLALVLTSIGTYGVVSYSTTRRGPEIGIRMALGAGRQEILWMVVGQGVRLGLAGVSIGAIVALILGRLLPGFSHLLYGVRPTDPLTMLEVSLILLVIVILACYVPALRAAKLDPMAVLRNE